MVFQDSASYREALKVRGELPGGFRIASGKLEFVPEEKPQAKPLKMAMNLLLLDKPTPSFAGVFTRNAFPGAPVLLGRKLIEEPFSRGVMINTKIANVGAPSGLEKSLRLQKVLAGLAECKPEELFVLSTGIIGWGLPVEAMEKALPEIYSGLSTQNVLALAEGIMTTDSYPKIRSAKVGTGILSGVAKGAGMIEPNMATMLSFLMTDVQIERDKLRMLFSEAVDESYNTISVDHDQSTSDTALIFSSNLKPPVSDDVWRQALRDVCGQLARDVVRNGEGTAHVLEVEVSGALDKKTARAVGQAVVNSPLVKTAVFGNDPNIGRILAAVGSYLGNNAIPLDVSKLELDIGTLKVFHSGKFDLNGEKEDALFNYMKEAVMDEKKSFPPHEKAVHFHVRLGQGNSSAVVLGSDLSHEYISVNADYRS